MQIQFACIHCDQRLSVSEKKVGARVKCPQCKAELTVPDQATAAIILEERRQRRDAERDNPFSEFAVFDEEPEIVYEDQIEPIHTSQPQRQEGYVDPDRVAVPRLVLYLQGGLLALVAIVAFTLGLLVGGAFGPAGGGGPAETGPHVVNGALYFQGVGQSTPPDVDAVVMILPRDTKPETRPDTSGIGPADPRPQNEHEALVAIRQMGGDYARTAADGTFQLNVPKGGRFYVLFISQERQRSENAPLDASMLASLGGYFQNADELIGEHAYQWREERLRSDKTLTWVFE